jgi:hypothetical protein
MPAVRAAHESGALMRSVERSWPDDHTPLDWRDDADAIQRIIDEVEKNETKERRHWPGGVGGRKEMGTFEAERRVDERSQQQGGTNGTNETQV